ncbi:MAG: nucleotide excision repair endonuclease, partial [Verrucomicrobiota bacterium]
MNSEPTIQLRLLPVSKPLAERFDAPFFRSIPKQPGVYLMRDSDDQLLYVGKSVNLRQRLSSYRYLQPEKHSRRLIRLVHAVRKISWEICETGQDAELRENLLLRTHRPKFNRMNTYPNAYFFIGLRQHHTGFALSLTR